MNASLSRLKIFSKNQAVLIEGTCDKDIQAGTLLLEERIKGNDLFIPRDVRIPCRVKRGAFRADLDLSLLSDLKSTIDFWDCYFVGRDRKQAVSFFTKGEEKYPFSADALSIVFYKNANRNLSVSVRESEAGEAILHAATDDSGHYRLSGELTGVNRRSFRHASLAVRKRDNKNSVLYKHETVFPLDFQSDSRWSAGISKQSIFPDAAIAHEEVWDLSVKLENGPDDRPLYLPLRNKAAFADDYTVIERNIFYQAKFYINKKGCVGLWVKRIPRYFEAKNITFSGSGQLNIVCKKPQHEKVVGARLEIDTEKWSESFNGFSLNGSVEEEMTSVRLTFPAGHLNDLYKIEKNDRFIVMIRIEDAATGVQTWMPLLINGGPAVGTGRLRLTSELAAVLQANARHEIEVMIMNYVSPASYHKGPVNLAILGSCYTRGAFNSSPYFNPGYKDKYTITFTQFHSSIPSLMSRPVSFPDDFFRDKKAIEKDYLKSDFEKLFFEKLSEAKAEYFLFDLYPDAVRDLVVYDDQHIVTGNFYLRNRPFLQSLTGKARFISHDDEQAFLNYWCPAADAFADAIVRFFPQERIILQKARMINRYYDPNYQIKFFSDQLNLVKRSNMYFQFMESYLLHRLPHIHTIDLNRYGYIGRFDHPDGQSTNHYEPDYYRKLVRELDRIIFEQDQTGGN